MSKMDEIKERLKYWEETLYPSPMEFEIPYDLKYLISKLEIAEKALEGAKYKSQILASYCAHRIDSGGTADSHNMFDRTQDIYESLEQALQQLRE